MAVDITETEASRRAKERMAAAGLSIRQMWADLDLAWDVDDVQRYLESQLSALPEAQRPRVLGMAVAFAVVAVEQERVNVRFRLKLGRR